MTVAELMLLFSDLGKFLRASEAAKVASELEYISAKLTPFCEYKLKAFADFLEKAEAYSRGELPLGKATTPKTARRPRADAAAQEEACRKTLELYNQAVDPSMTLERIADTIDALTTADPPKAMLDKLAKAMGIERKLSSKAAVIKAVHEQISGRKGAKDRVNA